MNKKLKYVFALLCAVVLMAGIGLFSLESRFTEEKVDFQSLISDSNNVKEFAVEDGYLTALSDDPWIVYNTDKEKDYLGITLNVNYLSEDYKYTDIFICINGDFFREGINLEEGENRIEFNNAYRGVDYIRLDLLNEVGQQAGIESMVVNDREFVVDFALYDLWLSLSFLADKLSIIAIPVIIGAFIHFYIKSSDKKRLMLILSGVTVGIILLSLVITYASIGFKYKERKIEPEDFVSLFSQVKDYEVEEKTLTALSGDPWLTYRGDRLNNVRLVTVDVADMSMDSTSSEIFVFYSDNDRVIIPGRIKQGENTFTLPESNKKVDNIRVDLTYVVGSEMTLNDITFNKYEKIVPVIMGQWLSELCSVLLWLAISISPVLLVPVLKRIRAHKGKAAAFLSKLFMPLVAAGLLLTYLLSFNTGIAAFIPALLSGCLIGTFMKGNIKLYKLAIGLYALISVFIYILISGISTDNLLFSNDGGSGIRIFIAGVYYILLFCCAVALIRTNDYDKYKEHSVNFNLLFGIGFDSLVIFLMTVALEMTAKVFFEQMDVYMAFEAVMESSAIFLNLMLVAVIYMFIRWLFGGVVGRGLALFLYAIIYIGNFVKLKYHDSTFKPMDILQINDFFNIVTMYVPAVVLVILLVVIVIGLGVLAYKYRSVILRRKPSFSIAAVCLFITVSMANMLEANRFVDLGCNMNRLWLGTKSCVKEQGVVAYSYLKFKEISDIYPKADKNYSKDYMLQLKSDFDKLNNEAESDIKPDVILVMEESMSDIQRIPDVEFSMAVNENMNKYAKATTISPKYGGATGSVEFEALTGMSNYFFLDNVVPYVTYWNNDEEEIPSLAREFNNNGYNTVAIHPNNGTTYNRNNVYQCMGFDSFIEKKDLPFTNENITSDGYFTDAALAEVIKGQLDKNKEPSFVFAVTIENHTLYENKYKETEVKVSSDKLSEKELYNLEQYSQGVLNADRFIAEMVEYVDNAQRPTILYIWGDHLPALDAFGTLGYIEDKYNKYGTPLVAYSNFKEINVDCEYITPNQLAPQILRDAEINYSSYFDFIYSLREKYPVIHKEFGINSEDEDIKKYEIIQYDLLFGKKYLLGYD